MIRHRMEHSKAGIRSFFLSWSSAHLVLCSSLLLSACGFSPMYGQKHHDALSAGILIEAPRDELGRQLQHALEDRLNPSPAPATPAYKLTVTLTSSAGGIGVARDGTISRYNITLTSSYTLMRLSDKRVIQTDNIQHISSFNNPVNQYFSTYIAQKNAMTQGVNELSELYRQRIGTLLLKTGTL